MRIARPTVGSTAPPVSSGGAEAHGDRVVEKRADDDRLAGGGVDAGDLAVIAEAAVGAIDAARTSSTAVVPIEVAVVDHEADPGADRPPVGRPGVGHEDPVAAWTGAVTVGVVTVTGAAVAVDRVAAVVSVVVGWSSSYRLSVGGPVRRDDRRRDSRGRPV